MSITDDDIAEIIQYRAEKKSWRAISEKTGFSVKTLQRRKKDGLFGDDVD
jgi:DNA-binding Lrp family transcriptional regulator